MTAKMKVGICGTSAPHENDSCFSFKITLKTCHQIHLPETTVYSIDTLSGKIHQLAKILKYWLVSPSSCPRSVWITRSFALSQPISVTLSCLSSAHPHHLLLYSFLSKGWLYANPSLHHPSSLFIALHYYKKRFKMQIKRVNTWISGSVFLKISIS